MTESLNEKNEKKQVVNPSSMISVKKCDTGSEAYTRKMSSVSAVSPKSRGLHSRSLTLSRSPALPVDNNTLGAVISSTKLVNAWRKRKASRLYSKLLEKDAVTGKDATSGPMSRLWECHRIRSSGSRKNSHFTDSWILREFKVEHADMPLKAGEEPVPSPSKQAGRQAVWCIRMSSCGSWMAVGTQGGLIYLYKTDPQAPLGLFNETPYGIYKKHYGAIIDIVFIENMTCNFPEFVSIAMDKTLCFWRASLSDPLASVRTSEWTSSITFRPSSPDTVILGVLDATVQFWRIKRTDNGVTMLIEDYIRVPDVVTAVSVSADSKWLAVGVRHGRVAMYDCQTLRFSSEVECKNKRWRSPGKKVVGIDWAPDSQSYLVTTHDSVITRVTLNGETQKFTGHTLQYLLLKGHQQSGNGRVYAASEDNCIYTWNVSDSKPGHFDKIKVSDELLTSFLIPPQSFNTFVTNSVHAAMTMELGGKTPKSINPGKDLESAHTIESRFNADNSDSAGITTESCSRAISRSATEESNDTKVTVAICGTYTGDLKVFANFGLTQGFL